MAFRVVVTEVAEHDLNGIADYTRDTWGEQQAVAYMQGLTATLYNLADKPNHAGKVWPGALKNMRVLLHYDHYYVFYEVGDKVVTVVRVLHQRRDSANIILKDMEE